MSKPVVGSLDGLWDEAQKRVSDASGLARRTMKAAWKAGRALQAVKDASPHGTFRKGLADRGITSSTDHRLRTLYKNYDMSQVGTFDSVSEALASLRQRPALPPSSGETVRIGVSPGPPETPETVTLEVRNGATQSPDNRERRGALQRETTGPSASADPDVEGGGLSAVSSPGAIPGNAEVPEVERTGCKRCWTANEA